MVLWCLKRVNEVMERIEDGKWRSMEVEWLRKIWVKGRKWFKDAQIHFLPLGYSKINNRMFAHLAHMNCMEKTRGGRWMGEVTNGRADTGEESPWHTTIYIGRKWLMQHRKISKTTHCWHVAMVENMANVVTHII